MSRYDPLLVWTNVLAISIGTASGAIVWTIGFSVVYGLGWGDRLPPPPWGSVFRAGIPVFGLVGLLVAIRIWLRGGVPQAVEKQIG